ncbi:hypothetical protein DRQ21_04780 [Candidatus Fermentibacteria bacterium]|nr:MAG: hypothetical protein DRQ21_04780 [Candidatus Fermentibacteria bacterium]
MNRVTAAVVLYNSEKLVPGLAETVNSFPDAVRTVVYDSGSSDKSAEAASRLISNATVIEGPNRGFGYGNNRCIETVETTYTLLLNSDAAISPESLQALVSFMDDHPDYAGVQPLIRLWGWDKVTVSAGVFLTGYGEAWDSRFMHLELSPLKTPLQVPAVTAAVSLWRTDALRSVDGFDESFFMYFEDADLSLRLGSSGWKLGVVRKAEAFHMVGASSTRRIASEWELASSVRLFRKYLGHGKLSFSWWKREAKILLHSIKTGKPAVWRLPLILGELKKPVKTVDLSEEVRSVVFGEPLDYPRPRTRSSSKGPGWSGNHAAPWAGIKTRGKPVDLRLTAGEHAVTGAVSGPGGDLLTRFCISPGKTQHVKLAETPSVVYIHCDSSSDRVEVLSLKENNAYRH